MIDYIVLKTPVAWSAAEDLLCCYYPNFFQGSKELMLNSEHWERYKLAAKTTLVLATYAGDVLGFAVGGNDLCSGTSYLHSVVVLPSWRRQGIGSRLVKRFFAHTCLQRVAYIFFKQPEDEPYEIANFVLALGGSLTKRSERMWFFTIPNPNLAVALK